MKEIGGYIELDQYRLPMLHDSAVALNCGRNCLAYLIRARKIKKIVLPYFLCDSVRNICEKEHVKIRYYHIGMNFFPQEVEIGSDEWLYLVNYYGQMTNEQIIELRKKYQRIIVDQAQAYFDMPVEGVDTLYTCRKFLGVPDGAFLYTDADLEEELQIDESFERMHFLLGRFERSASEFYGEYAANNHLFADEPIKEMSKLTKNFLHAIDYQIVRQRRTENFTVLHDALKEINLLQLAIPEGAFMYPFYLENGAAIRKQLQTRKIYIPTLWPNVIEDCGENTIEADMASNILPIPVDQRYTVSDMKYLIEEIMKCIS